MKTRRLTIAVLPLLLLLAAQSVQAQTRAGGKTTVGLNSGWTFRQVGKEEWRRATVPGSVHTDLLANRLIEDPFYRDNGPKLQWVGRTDWEYRTTFDAPSSLLARRNVGLVFEGLDTYATVFLNDRPVLEADNMFRTWRVDAKPSLRPGANTLRARLTAGGKVSDELSTRTGLRTVELRQQRTPRARASRSSSTASPSSPRAPTGFRPTASRSA